jgi:hypothetical protein
LCTTLPGVSTFSSAGRWNRLSGKLASRRRKSASCYRDTPFALPGLLRPSRAWLLVRQIKPGNSVLDAGVGVDGHQDVTPAAAPASVPDFGKSRRVATEEARRLVRTVDAGVNYSYIDYGNYSYLTLATA